MNIFNDIHQQVLGAIAACAFQAKSGELDLSKVAVEPPRDPSHGDMATNAALILAKQVGQPPRDCATRIAEYLQQQHDIDTAEVAGPGFVNIRLSDAFWSGFAKSLLQSGKAYGRDGVGQGERVNVEYVSANPTGPLHVGHARGAVVGDAIANLLEFVGYDVTKEYYTNDAGSQIDTLARSAFQRYREAMGEEIGEIPAGLYPGAYLKRAGARAKEEFGARYLQADETEWLAPMRELATAEMMQMIREDLAELNIHHEIFASEKALHAGSPSKIDQTLDDLAARNLVYEGKLPPPKGGTPEDWEDREQLLFRATEFGDDIDRPLKKSDGSYTYFAADVAYFRDKFERDFSRAIYVLGVDHSGYVKRLQAIGNAIAGNQVDVQVLFTQLVKLFRAGEPVRMSKRSGDFITLRELVEEVGVDAVRFMMLFRKADAPLDFDFQSVTEQSKDNPVFYVQYAHARCHSIYRQAASETPDISVNGPDLANADLSVLTDKGERGLIKKTAEFPRILEAAAAASEPHRIAFYLHELAGDFHAHWNRGKELPNLRYINASEPELTRARLALVETVRQVIESGLNVLGVSVPTEMR